MTKTLLSLALACHALVAAPDTVDTSFTNNAGVYYDANDFGGVASMLVQPDGKLLVGSNWMSAVGGTIYPPLIRFNLDGTVDEDFHADNTPNGQGSGIFYDLQGQPEVHGLALQSDGKIIAVGCMQGMRNGTTTLGSTLALISNGIVRITPGGDPDPTFQCAGIDTEFIDEVVTLSNDKIIIAGGFNAVRNQGGSLVTRVGIAQLNADGSLDTTFSVNPATLGNFALNSLFIRQVAPAPDGKLYIVGSAQPAGGTIFDDAPVFARLNADGTVDGGFNPTYPPGVTSFSGVVVEATGNVVALGSLGNTSGATDYMERFSNTGAPQASFTLASTLPRISARPLRVDPLGRFLLSKRDSAQGNSQLVRINADGSLDPTFNASGAWAAAPFGATNAFLNQAITSPTGRIYAGGSFDSINGVNTAKIVAFEGDNVPNSPGTLQLAYFAASATEDEGTIVIPVVRNGGSTGAATVDYSFADINATAGSDYTATSGTLTFAAGEAGTKFISIPLVNDSLVETLEVFTITLGNATGAALGSLITGYNTIIDSDSPPVIIAQPVPVYAPPLGFFQIAVGALSGKEPTSYQWFRDGVAIAGATSPLYYVTSANAATHDGDYTVTVTNPNGSVTSDIATVVIKNPARLRFASSSQEVVESDGSVTVTLTRGNSSVNAVSVEVTAQAGTATSPADFTNTSQTVSWADGDDADKTVTLTLADDLTPEDRETLTLTLSNPSVDAEIAFPTVTTVTILDDDSLPVISAVPEPLLISAGRTLSLAVTSDSQTPASYQWFLNGVALPDQTAEELSLPAIGYSATGTYTVEITNGAGSVTSAAIPVQVIPADLLISAIVDAPNAVPIVALAPAPGGAMYAGGGFNTLGGQATPRLALVNPDGSVDASFAPGFNSQDSVQFLRLTAGGDLIVGGRVFSGTGIMSNRLAKISPAGVVDPVFKANVGSVFDNQINDFEIAADGSIFVVGSFTGRIKKLSPAGVPDPTFNPTIPPAFGGFVNIDSIEIIGSDLFIGGNFDGSNGLAKLDFAGNIDSNFDAMLNGRAEELTADAQGDLLFRYYVSSQLGYRIRKISTAGIYDPTFDLSEPGFSKFLPLPDGSLLVTGNGFFAQYASDGSELVETRLAAGTAFDSNLSDLELASDGFVWGAGPSRFNGIVIRDLVRLQLPTDGVVFPDGPLDTVVNETADAQLFAPASGTSFITSYQWYFNGNLIADGSDYEGTETATLTIKDTEQSDEGNYTVVATNAAGQSATSDPALLTVLGAPEPAWTTTSPVSSLQGPNLTIAGTIAAAPTTSWEIFRDGTSIATGSQSSQTGTVSYTLNNVTVADAGSYTLVATNSFGTTTSEVLFLDIRQRPMEIALGFTGTTNTFSGAVWSIAPTADGGAYLAGDWFNWNFGTSTLTANLAKVDAAGQLVTSFLPRLGQDRFHTPSVIELADGRVVFAAAGINIGNASGQELVAMDATGAHDPAFTTNLGSGPNGAVRTLAEDAAGNILIAGAFSRVNGSPAATLARLLPNGTLDSGFTPALTGNLTTKVRVANDGSIFLKHDNKLRKVSAAGVLDSSFALSLNGSEPNINDFVPDGQGRLLVTISSQGTHRFLANGQLDASYNPAFSTALAGSIEIDNEGKALLLAANRVTRLLDDGTLDPAFSPTPTIGNSPYTLAVSPQGPIWVGGVFTSPRYRYLKYAGTPAAVTITNQPQPQIVEPNASATFAITTVSTGPLSYQWFRNGSPLSDGVKYTGTTAATLVINNASEADEGLFSVVATHLFTSDSQASQAAPLTVLGLPEVTSPPADTTVLVGETITLSAGVQAAGPFTLQWQKDGVDLSDGGAISGATTATLTIEPSQASDSGDYTLVITNSLGTVTSPAAEVRSVPNPASLTAGFTAPIFNNTVRAILPLPNGQTLVGGDFTSVADNGVTKSRSRLALVNNDGSIDDNFTLAAGGTVHDLFLDSSDRVLLAGSFTTLGGATARLHARLRSDLTIDPLYAPTGSPNNTVFAIAEDSNGDIWIGGQFSSSGATPSQARLAKFNQLGAPLAHSGSVNSTVSKLIPTRDGNLLISGSFSNFAGANAQKLAKFSPAGSLVTSYPTSGWSSIPAITESPLGLVYAMGYNGSKYTIEGFNPDGSLNETFVIPSSLTNFTSSSDLLAQENERLLFTINAQPYFGRLDPSGEFDPLFQQGTGLNNVAETLALENDGSIWVGGSFTSYNGTTVGRLLRLQGDLVDLAIRQQPENAVVDIGTSTTFTTFAETLNGEPIGYQWRKDGVEIAGATSASYTIAVTAESDEALYDVVVTNLTTTTEKISRPATLLVLSTPEVVVQPTAQMLEAGQALTLSVEARGAGTLSYQWQQNGNDLPGATASSYQLPSSSVSDSGTYRVLISNSLGNLTSAEVVVSVVLAPAARVESWPNPALNSTLNAILPLPDGRTLVGGNFTQANPGSGAQTIRSLALLDATGNIDLSFNLSLNNTVLDLALDHQGRILVGGNFTTLAGQSRNRVARLNPNLTLDSSFNPGLGPNSTVNAISPLSDGSIAIGGEFTSVAGHSTSFVARLAENGAVDPDFVSATNGSVYDLAAEPSGKISAVGRFTSTGRNYFLRMNDDGSIDQTFTAGGTSNWLYRVELLSDGNYLVAGASGQLARYSAAGTRDNSFVAPSINGTITALTIEQDGQLLIGGSFATIGGVSSPRLGRLNGDGTFDSAFGVQLGANSTVNTIALQALGRIWVGGAFTSYRGNSNSYLEFLNGDKLTLGIVRQPSSLAADLTTTATLTVTALAADGAGLSYQWRKNGLDMAGETASTLTLSNLQESDQASYDVVITNTTTLAGVTSLAATLNVLSSPEILSLTGDQTLESRQALALEVEAEGAGAVSYQWKKNGLAIAGATSPLYTIPATVPDDSATYTVEISNALGSVTSDPITVAVSLPPAGLEAFFPNYTFANTVWDILPLPDGRTLVAGQFLSIQAPGGGNNNISYLVLFNADRSIDTSFNLSVNSTVNTLALAPDGGVFLGGSFTTVGGQVRNRHAKLLPNLTLAPGFGALAAPNSTIQDLVPAPDGGAYLGGIFTQVNGNSSFRYLCHLKADGTLNTRFQPGLNSTVNALLSDGLGVIAGGAFTTPQSTIARFDGSGSHDASFTGTLNQQVNTLARAHDGSFYAGGQFGALRRFTATGQWDSSFAPFVNSHITSLAVEADGQLLLGGNFTSLAGGSRNRVGRLNTNGSLDATFDPGTGANNSVNTIAIEPLGGLWIGGTFTTYRDETIGRIAFLNGDQRSLGIAQHPGNRKADFGASITLTVVAQSAANAPLSYQWRKNGIALPGETSATLTFSNLTLADTDPYDVIVTNETTTDQVVSNPAQLTVLATPEILLLDNNLASEVGENLLLAVEAQGAGALSYQWRKNGSPISGETASSFTIPALTLSDSGNYTVVVSNSLGMVTSAVIELDVFIPPAGIFPGSNGSLFNNVIYDSVELPSGKILVAGAFTSLSAEGTSVLRGRLALLNNDGTFDPSFDVSVNNTVREMEVDSQGRVLLVGDFTTVAGQARNRHARLNSDLTLDSTFATTGGPNSNIYCVEVDSLDRVYLGGLFSSWSDTANNSAQTSGAYLVRLLATGDYDGTFNDVINSWVYDLEVQDDDQILVGGRFSSPDLYFTRLNPDGTTDSAFAGGSNNWIYALGVLSDGSLVAAGRSGTARRYDSSGNFSSTISVNSDVEDIAIDSSDNILLAGSYSNLQGVNAPYLGRLTSDGSYDSNFDIREGPSSSVYSVTQLSDGRIAIGGVFTTYRGSPAQYFTLLNGDPALDPFESYLANFTLPASELGEGDDPDGDSLPNLLEFLYSTDPSAGPALEIVSKNGGETGDNLALNYPSLGFLAGETYETFTVLFPKDLQGASLVPETSTNLVNFGDGTINPVLLTTTSFNALYDLRTYAYDQPVSVAPMAYARVSAAR